MLAFIKLTSFFTFIALCYSQDNVTVSTKDGLVSGSKASTTTNKPFYAFDGIPFASPPIGNLRFKPPIPPKPWTGVLNASQPNKVMCRQTNDVYKHETEDCLFLNVYTPHIPSIDDEDNTELLPVMFYIFGGGFFQGSYDFDRFGPEFLLDRDVILVTTNYRLGPFGFLSTGDGVIPGNMGLKDQSFALKWTYDNIKVFGGDPEKITIFGQSAGSVSVAYQLLNPQARGLFRAAICQSGTFLNPLAFTRDPRSVALNTAKHIDKDFDDQSTSEELLEFFLSVDADELDNAARLIMKQTELKDREQIQGHHYAPVIEPEGLEGAVFTRKQYGLLKDGEIAKVPVLLGINSEESLAKAADLASLKKKMGEYDVHKNWMVPNSMRIDHNDSLHSEMGRKIHTLYAGDGLLQDNLASGIRFWSDAGFTRSIIKFAKMLSAHTDVYFYQFSYDGVMGNENVHIDGAENVAHAEDVRYIFRITRNGYDNSDLSKYPESDVLTHNRITKIWTDFAKHLNPTPKPSELLQNLIWPKVSPDDYKYVDINENLKIKTQPKKETFPQWEAMFDSLGYDDFDTY